jgi:NADH-quinone oxidoreductase subunit N
MFELPTLAELNLGATIPALAVALWACIVLVVDLWIPKAAKSRTAWLAAGGLVFALVANLFTYNDNSEAFMGAYITDQFTGFAHIVILLTGFITILMSVDYLERIGVHRGEYYALLLLTISGAMFMAAANDLTVVFVGLELLSIPLYILSAWRTGDSKSEEAGVKYLILGAFASAFFVFGAAFVYGATGSTSLPIIFDNVAHAVSGEGGSALILLLGTGFLIVGLGFKVAVVPFHMWTPDVYEGAPTPVTAFMSVGAKVGGFTALIRIMMIGLPALTLPGDTATTWQLTVGLIAALTLIFGNLVAISQTNIKRLLAYSSIAHAGYILMAVAAVGSPGAADSAAQAALIYLLAYMFTNIGAFAIAMAIERADGSGLQIDDFIGLANSRPLLAFMMAFFMLSLTGIPLTSGFVGKWLVFSATLEAGLVWLAVIGVLTSVISAFYYVRIIVNMYLRDGEGDSTPSLTRYLNWAIYASFVGTLLLGVIPTLATNLTEMIATVGSIFLP